MGLFSHKKHRKKRRRKKKKGPFRKVSNWFNDKPFWSRYVASMILGPAGPIALGIAARMERDIREGKPAGQVIAGAVGEVGMYVATAGIIAFQPELVVAGTAMQAGARAWQNGEMTERDAINLSIVAANYATGAEIDPAEDYLEQFGAETAAQALAATETIRRQANIQSFGPLFGQRQPPPQGRGLSGLFGAQF